jgi:hypothetical protein
MNRIFTLLGLMLSALILISCAAGRYPYPTATLSQENWRSQIESNPNLWAAKADQWFRAGGESLAQVENAIAPPVAAISRTSVRTAGFDSLKISGDFQVQISGDPDVDSVAIEGPNSAVRSVAVRVRNNVLCLEQVENAPAGMGRVVVHVSMRRFKALLHNGAGRVEGIRLSGGNVTVESTGSGNIFLAGHLNVKCVIARGAGCINIFTIFSSGTVIETTGSGDVNFDAKRAVVLHSIVHHGVGDINVIGAVSPGLSVIADGKGKIGVLGRLNIREIKASGETCVFIAISVSSVPCIYVYDDARVGVAGRACTLYGYTTRTSRLMARNLIAQTAYVQASGTSHMNITATEKIFATTVTLLYWKHLKRIMARSS